MVPVNNNTYPDKGCIAQEEKFNRLYYVGLAAESIIGAVAGVFFDYLGPLLTGCMGTVMFSLGWIFFSFTSNSLDLLYPGIILLAGAANMIGFPTLILADMYCNHSGWITSIVVAAESASSIVPTILLAIMNAYPHLNRRTLFLSYFVLIVLPCFLCFLISLPFQREIVSHYHADQELTEENKTRDDHRVSSEDNGIDKVNNISFDIGISSTKVQPPILIMQIISPEYIFFLIFYVLQQLQYAFFPNFVKDEIGSAPAHFLASILPFQGIIGPIIGAVAQKTKSLPIACILALSMSLVYTITLLWHKASIYALIIVYVVANSYIYTIRYTYVAETFPVNQFGILVGISGGISGLVTLIVGFLPKPTRVLGCTLYTFCGVISFACALLLIARHFKLVNGSKKKSTIIFLE
ncbi:cationic amino acid transporter 8-like isoform X2 [Hylaeus volcanicus]|uniref:cationic amino acid transporter 8-like isoform X2 n=1 Tax=Hylaeus volcanicus TaxID=313075 RepID=UPI0023B86A18|nr:cationic amino acid transporter 8-like isoform X2 [Hylaeus volcanicus]